MIQKGVYCILDEHANMPLGPRFHKTAEEAIAAAMDWLNRYHCSPLLKSQPGKTLFITQMVHTIESMPQQLEIPLPHIHVDGIQRQ